MERTGRIFLCSLLLLLFTGVAGATPTPLANEDCLKCHDEIVETVTARGSKHNSAVTCLDCHIEHPPKGTEVIPACSMCHDPGEKTHYTIDNCITCHYPHYPLEINFDKVVTVKPVCITCHSTEGKQLADYPSKHSELDCKECHLEHGKFLVCMECHTPHTPEMEYKDCIECHKPHMPTVVKYPETIPSAFCSGCHEKETNLLSNCKTLHRDLGCAYCHKSQHKVIPQCATCHGEPHTAILHEKFPDCLKCHIDAHGLEK